jgi:hypothetical protein
MTTNKQGKDMSTNYRLNRLEQTLEQRPTATYRHARDLTDYQLLQLIEGNDVGIKLITTPAEREAYNKLSDTDLATIKRVSDRLSKNYNDKGGRL